MSNDDDPLPLEFLSTDDLRYLYAVSRWHFVVVSSLVTGEGLEVPDDLGTSQIDQEIAETPSDLGASPRTPNAVVVDAPISP
eukprot:6877027-Alexandrium_andersonii.AAC.1